MKVVDIDAVVPDAIGFRIDGEIYELPGDIPVPTYLQLAELFDRVDDRDTAGEDRAAAMQDIYDLLLELFQDRNPNLDTIPVGPRRAAVIVMALYNGDGEEQEPEEAPKARKRPAGTKKKTQPTRRKKAATKSRSSS